MTRQQLQAFLATVGTKALAMLGPIGASLLLLTLGGVALLARGALSQTPPSQRNGLAAQFTASIGDAAQSATPTAATRPTYAPTPTPYPTPTAGVYSGPNYMRVEYNRSSCANGMASPYPVLNLYNTSPDTPLFWQLRLSNTAYTLYQNPPSPIPPGWSDYLEFDGPSPAPGTLSVTLSGSIGSWSGVLTPCAFATPTYAPLPVTITCSSIEVDVDGRICVHTHIPATITVTVVYCDGRKDPTASLIAQPTDAQGNHTFDWIPETTCIGPATVTVTVTYGNQTGTTTFTVAVTTYPTPTAAPTATPTP
jgi:hypothetical protein